MSQPAKTRLMPYAVSSGCACVAAIAVALLLQKPVAVYGAVAASFGALCGLSALATFAGRGINGVLVAVGLLASGARGNAALSYVFSFFGVYLATQIVEILFVARGAQGATP